MHRVWQVLLGRQGLVGQVEPQGNQGQTVKQEPQDSLETLVYLDPTVNLGPGVNPVRKVPLVP